MFWNGLHCHLYFVTPHRYMPIMDAFSEKKNLKEKIRTVDHHGRNYACWQSDEQNKLCDNTTTATILPLDCHSER